MIRTAVKTCLHYAIFVPLYELEPESLTASSVQSQIEYQDLKNFERVGLRLRRMFHRALRTQITLYPLKDLIYLA